MSTCGTWLYVSGCGSTASNDARFQRSRDHTIMKRTQWFCAALMCAILGLPQVVSADQPVVLSTSMSASPSWQIPGHSMSQQNCPVKYMRHSWKAIQNGTLPYLFGGLAQKGSCINCKGTRIGTRLWSRFCGWRKTGSAFWDQQLCSARVTQQAIQHISRKDQKAALLMTPCDLWQCLRGRTTWIIG